MGYVLGIDLGTTFTAAAVMRDGRAEVVPLGNHAATIPTMVFLREDDTVLIGDAAERRGVNEPSRLAREFKRRLGDTAPIMLDRTPFSADRLLGLMLRQILADVSERQGGAPDLVAITHPANWGEYKIDLLRQAVEAAGIRQAVYISEPVAAALQYAAGERVEPGETVAVYDLGGGTFDAAVLRKVTDGFELLGRPQGIERLGGIDFDEAVVTHVRKVVGDAIAGLDSADPSTRVALARLRQECVLAKETLSADSDATVPVLLPNVQTQVRITRAEFEDMVRPIVRETIESLQRALESAGVKATDLKAVLLAGGSSRIPLAADMVRNAMGRPVASDTHPKHAVALGAARFAAAAMASGSAQPTLLSGSILGSKMPLAAPSPAPAAPTPPSPPPLPPTAPVPMVPPPASAAPTVPMATVAAEPTVPVAAVPTAPTAPPARPKRPAWMWGAVAAAVAALVVVAVVVLGGGDDGSTGADTTVDLGAATTVADTTVPDTTNSTDTASPTSTTGDTTGFNGAGQTLADWVAADRATAEGLVGAYVVQLSAKYEGLEFNGVTYDNAAIVEDHLLYRDQYGAILVDGGAFDFEFNGSRMDGWYLTLLPTPFATRDDADQWCVDNGFTDCFGRLFKPLVSSLTNTACTDGGTYCVGIAAANWIDGTLVVTYLTEGFDPNNSGANGDQHVHFWFSSQDPASVGVPGSGLWYVWDRDDGGGELIFTGFSTLNISDYEYNDGDEVCISAAEFDHTLVQSSIYYCLAVPAL